MENEQISSKAKMLIAVAALGYFVDVYDLILFSVVRNPSLKSLGLQGPELLNHGLNLMNVQMGGMLLGGILWGIYGDKKGRKSVLFGSILLYSLANALNGWVTDLNTYAILRFIAGIGLAGELGAGITLVNETLPPSKDWNFDYCRSRCRGCCFCSHYCEFEFGSRMVENVLLYRWWYGLSFVTSSFRNLRIFHVFAHGCWGSKRKFLPIIFVGPNV